MDFESHDREIINTLEEEVSLLKQALEEIAKLGGDAADIAKQVLEKIN